MGDIITIWCSAPQPFRGVRRGSIAVFFMLTLLSCSNDLARPQAEDDTASQTICGSC